MTLIVLPNDAINDLFATAPTKEFKPAELIIYAVKESNPDPITPSPSRPRPDQDTLKLWRPATNRVDRFFEAFMVTVLAAVWVFVLVAGAIHIYNQPVSPVWGVAFSLCGVIAMVNCLTYWAIRRRF